MRIPSLSFGRVIYRQNLKEELSSEAKEALEQAGKKLDDKGCDLVVLNKGCIVSVRAGKVTETTELKDIRVSSCISLFNDKEQIEKDLSEFVENH